MVGPTLLVLDHACRRSDVGMIDEQGALDLAAAMCPQCSDDDQDEWIAQNLEPRQRIVPVVAYGTIESVEVRSGLGSGLVLILLTFPIVSRRVPG